MFDADGRRLIPPLEQLRQEFDRCVAQGRLLKDLMKLAERAEEQRLAEEKTVSGCQPAPRQAGEVCA